MVGSGGIGMRRELMRTDWPQFNHNGGDLAFGPDRMLYVSMGEGGSADDQGPGHRRGGNDQNLGVPLGKILRINVNGRNSRNGAYGIPPDNPFVSTAGALAEILALGFRNPFRLSFDRERGDLYVGDAGQNDLEEVDRVVAGGNYGWNAKEGRCSSIRAVKIRTASRHQILYRAGPCRLASSTRLRSTIRITRVTQGRDLCTR